jgi:hypothetical protein
LLKSFWCVGEQFAVNRHGAFIGAGDH